MSLRDELRATVRRRSAWAMWIVTAAVSFLLGYLVRHGWHW
jgi:hypothetical protein